MVDDTKSAESQSFPPVNPVRDNAFVRIYADIALCVNLPHGVEIALFQRSSSYKDVVMGQEGYPLSTARGMALTDVARLRMDDDDATTLAYNILLTIAESGIADVEIFDKNIGIIRTAIKNHSRKNKVK